MRDFYVEQQIRQLVDMGFSWEDAEGSLAWVLRRTPPHTSASTWIPGPSQMDDMTDLEAVQDAKTAYYQTAPDKFKRILDATDR